MASLTATPVWADLQNHYDHIRNQSLVESFKNDSHRHEKFSLTFGDILFDYSKNRIDDDTLPLLINLARQAQLETKINAMFSGEKINVTEHRAVLHTALRNRSNTPILV
ncbi:MAG: glucose-6-phosphate isomerase, partial [Methylococcales bacterium]|nr:glucose-6-phosphate isomerase [Methylococcales bacterium]